MPATRRSLFMGVSALGIARTGRAATTLRVGDQRGNMRAVLEAADALRGVPYDITWVEFPAAAPLIEALNAEAIELGVVGDAPFTFGFAAGVPMRVIAVRRSTQQGLAIVVPASSSVHTLADLQGKRIATGRGSVGHFLVLAALHRAGLSVDAVKLVFLLPADAKAALASGSVDAWSTGSRIPRRSRCLKAVGRSSTAWVWRRGRGSRLPHSPQSPRSMSSLPTSSRA
jgi:sulfonate transport system substrate-binding protein